MEFISWREEYSVGYEKIDSQHKKLVKLINELYDAFMTRSNSVGPERIIKELNEYVTEHFQEEEKLFAKYNYANTESHISEHNAFKVTFEEIVEKNKDNPKAFSTRITSFLQKWLINHILESDMQYKGLLQDK